MHRASAVGTPVVSLFGLFDPVIWEPLGDRNVVVIGHCSRTDLTAEECRSCAFQECLDSIDTEGVIRVVRERLKSLRGSPPANCMGQHFF
jgi:ADP-heptose:LPS heptosyltransferase